MTAESAGRRRCTIREHRIQLKACNKQIEFMRTSQYAQWLVLRDTQRECEEWRAKYQALKSWRWTWFCRTFGHYQWLGRFGPGWCGRCGARLNK